MKTILYIHGFLSSPTSQKAQLISRWLGEHHPEIKFICPFLTPYPDECAMQLNKIVQERANLGIIGSSLGGFWASHLVEHYRLPAVLINPAVNVFNLIKNHLHEKLKNYHHDADYQLTEKHAQQIQSYITKPTQHHLYWLLAQKEDETLDYRIAEQHYQGCKQTIEAGGNHSFQGLERHLDEIIDFFKSTDTTQNHKTK